MAWAVSISRPAAAAAGCGRISPGPRAPPETHCRHSDLLCLRRENIYGNFAVGLFGLTENHGSGYNQSLGPTNATGTPQIKNMLIKDVVLTETMGPAVVFSLAEAPIENFTLQNISWSMHKGVRGGYECTGWKGTKQVTGLFATGQAIDVTPPLPAQGCGFLGPPAGAAVEAPTTTPPCSLNGVGSPCVCDAGWTGKNCGQLDLLPAPPLASQVTALSATTTSNNAANSTWGISVVGPDKAGMYHGYMTEIANHCPLGDYGVASQVAHMTATHPLGPWSRKGIALKGFVSLRPSRCVPHGLSDSRVHRHTTRRRSWHPTAASCSSTSARSSRQIA